MRLLCYQSCCLHLIFAKRVHLSNKFSHLFFAMSITWHSITNPHSFYKTASVLFFFFFFFFFHFYQGKRRWRRHCPAMHLRCVWVLFLVGVNVTWAGLTRELSSSACYWPILRSMKDIALPLFVMWFAYLFFLEDFNQVFYLGFDRYNGDRLYDDSLHNNNATLKSAFLDKIPGSCGKCARVCCGGTIPIDGAKFIGKY